MAKDIDSIFFDITPEIEELALKCETNNAIDKELYTKYEVKRGLRDLNGKGVLAGMTMSNVTKEDIARATLEGVTYEFLLGLEAFRENGIAVKQITLTGGGSKSPFWRQLAADMTGCPVRVARITEAAAFGSALQALWLCSGKTIEEIAGEHLRYDESKSAEPDAEKHKLYQEHYRTWIGYVDAMTPLFR